MALKIYETASPSAAFSTDGAFTKPIADAFDGTLGAVIERKCYVRNDNALVSYSGITVQPIDGGDNIVSGNNGYSFKLYAGDTRPVAAQWALVTAGAAISLSDITDTTTYLPFWIRREVPAKSEVASFQNVVLRITATET